MKAPLILAFHSISPKPYPGISPDMSVTPDNFEKQLRVLLKAGYVNISPDKYLKLMQGHRVKMPARSFMITFDDGFADNYTYAFPILQKYHLQALVFLTANLMDTNKWFEGGQREDALAISIKQIKEMQSYGIIFGSHGLDHSHLSTLSLENQEANIRDSQRIIQDITGVPVRYYCAPYGDYSSGCEKIARKYYDASFLINARKQERQNKFVWNRVGIYRQNNLLVFRIKVLLDAIVKN
jgi:peptidoglycan/xylan/chitin deacetylase (PgdA/CDA1 family)